MYPSVEPVLTTKSRNNFYYLTPPAVKEAANNNLVLPDLSSDLLFKGGNINISTAINIRNESEKYKLVFVPENNI